MRYSPKFYSARITETRMQFEELLRQVSASQDLSEKERLSRKAIILANKSSTGYYSSEIIEDVFTTIAQKHSIPLKSEYKENTFLHVMTQGYETGGHTRVVERWIENSPEQQQHDVVFIGSSPACVIARMMQSTAEKNGTVHELDQEKSDLDKALELRRLASQYAYIILHVHMDDVVPLIAFGTPEFTRPVIFFNHADHRFWLGCSIADAVAELREWGINISKTRRGINVPSLALGIPMTYRSNTRTVSKTEKRQALGIPEKARVVTTVGGWHKYKPLFHLDFLKIAESLLQRDASIHIIAIGPSCQHLPEWSRLCKQYGDRFRALGALPPEQMFDYLACSDLSLDSFPMSGGTALIDAITAGCPVLSMDCPTGQLDYVIQSGIYCKDLDTLMHRSIELLYSPEKAEKNKAMVSTALLECHSKEAWLQKLSELYQLASTHSLHRFTTTPSPVNDYSILDYYLYSESFREKVKFRIPGILTLYSVHVAEKKRYSLRFFS